MAITVNGFPITEQSVDFELRRLVDFYTKHMPPECLQKELPQLREKARKQAIGTLLLRWDAERLHIHVPDEEVEETIQTMMTNAGSESRFKQILQSQSLSLQELRHSIQSGKRIDRLVAKITTACDDPREEELRCYFEAHRAEYINPESACARHVLVRPASETDEDGAVAQSKMREIRSKIEDGADFGDMAATYSECPSGKKSGGSLGWINRGSMVPEFDSIIFGLQDGELSDVVETPLGYHVIQRTASKGPLPSDFHECVDKIRELLRHDARGRLITAYVEELHEKVEIVDDGK